MMLVAFPQVAALDVLFSERCRLRNQSHVWAHPANLAMAFTCKLCKAVEWRTAGGSRPTSQAPLDAS